MGALDGASNRCEGCTVCTQGLESDVDLGQTNTITFCILCTVSLAVTSVPVLVRYNSAALDYGRVDALRFAIGLSTCDTCGEVTCFCAEVVLTLWLTGALCLSFVLIQLTTVLRKWRAALVTMTNAGDCVLMDKAFVAQLPVFLDCRVEGNSQPPANHTSMIKNMFDRNVHAYYCITRISASVLPTSSTR